MIGEQLDLAAGNLLAVFIPRGGEEASVALYKEVADAVTNIVYPKVVGHLEASQAVKTIHARPMTNCGH